MNAPVITLIDAMPNSHAEVEAFIGEFLSRYQNESEESFAGSYPEPLRHRALELFQTYLDVITESLEMSGRGGYARVGRPTEEEQSGRFMSGCLRVLMGLGIT